ncbi:MAG: outer rane transport energization protein ExbD [Sphingobacteriales bacterium]|nr:outer rane transport energization protein ExbD [Sphingobacteriales bacterium]
MPRIKVARKSTAIDMTAMCDVAFLLLTFFILTATARQPEALAVDTPASTTLIKLPETDIATLTIGQGKVFFGVKGQNVRALTLEKVGNAYGIKFTPEEIQRFSVMESFGVPIGNLKQIIKLSGPERNKEGLQTGIPADSVNNRASELNEWILQARYATKELNNKDMRLSIKGDAKEEYPTIKKVINILQVQNVNKFSLITSMRATEK